MKASFIFTAIAATAPGSALAIPILQPNSVLAQPYISGGPQKNHGLNRPADFNLDHRVEAEPDKDHGVKVDITVICEPPNKCRETEPKKTGKESSDTHFPFWRYALNRWARDVGEGSKKDEPHVPNPKSREWGTKCDKELPSYLKKLESNDGTKTRMTSKSLLRATPGGSANKKSTLGPLLSCMVED